MANQVLRQRLIAWAEQQVQEHPTHETTVWDDAQKKPVAVETPNTIERALAVLLSNNLAEELLDYTKADLCEFAVGLATDGTKGYRQMSQGELLDEIEEEMADPDLFPEATAAVEIADQLMEEIDREANHPVTNDHPPAEDIDAADRAGQGSDPESQE